MDRIHDDHHRYHSSDPDTSKEAAERLTTGTTDQVAILTAHCQALMGADYQGFTDYESGDLSGIDHWNARKRCNDLRKEGLLRFSGESRVNPGSNRRNNISVVTDEGVDVFLGLVTD